MTKAIILAAGRGERLRPLTDKKPKALLPVGNKPIISYLIDQLKEIGVDEIAIVVNYLGHMIKSEFGDSFKYYEDKLVKGTGSALAAAKDFIDDDVIVAYGDLFFDGNLEGILRQKNSMLVYKVSDVSKYGKVEIRDGEIVDIKEKTEVGPGLINAGLYHLPQSVVDYLENITLSSRGEYELTDILIEMTKSYEFKPVVFSGYWKDIGYPWDYLDANMYVLDKIGFLIGENVEIWPNATIRKPVIIGDNTIIKNSVLEKSVIGNDCVIGEFSIVKRSVIMNNSNAPHLNYVGDSVIAENVNLGAGTVLSNLRFDNKGVKVEINGKIINSGRRKLGAIIGYDVKVGTNVTIYPGKKIGSDSWIGANIVIRRNVPNGSRIR